MPPGDAARADNAALRAVFEHAGVGMAVVAPDGRFLQVNAKLCEIVGYSPAELRHKTFHDLTHPDDLAADLALTRRLLAGELPGFTLERRYVRKDGTVVGVELTVALVRDASGAPLYSVSAINDITARRRAEAKAEAARVLLSQAFERVTDAFVALDRDWRYTYVNARAGEIFGRKPEDLIGKHIWTEFPEGVGQPFHRAYERALAEQKPVRFEDYYPPYDRWFENIVYPSPDGLSIYFHDITERKRAEQALRDSERRLRSLFDQAADGIFVLTPDHRYLDANTAGLQMLGYSREELLQLRLPDVLAEHERSRLSAEVPTMMAGRPHLAEWEHRRKDGSTFPAEVSARPLSNGSYLAIVRDLSARRQAEQALHESEARYRRAVDAAYDGIWEWDPNTGEDYLSPRWKKLLGFEDHELPNREESFFELIHPDDRPLAADAIRRHLEQRVPYELELRMRHKSGEYRWILTRGQAEWDAQGKPLRMAGSITDITERKRAEAERLAALARFETLFRHAPEAMSISELDIGRFIQVNDAFCTMVGYRREELIGRTSLDLGMWTDPAGRQRLLDDLRGGRTVVATQGRVRTRSGERRDTQFSAARIDFGGADCLLLMFVDVTDRLRAQRQVEAHERQLADLARRLMTKEEEERKALAQTLHDRFAQNLAAAKLGVEGVLLQGDAARMADGQRSALRRVVDSLDEALTEVRGLLTDLRPPLLAEFGLRAALRQEIESRRALHPRVEIELLAPPSAAAWPPQRLAPSAEFGLFYIAREALANALLHAQAHRITVELYIDEVRTRVVVRDDGVGFCAGCEPPHGHLGLTGMRERAALIGATLDIDAAIGHGTTVTATCPAAAALPATAEAQ